MEACEPGAIILQMTHLIPAREAERLDALHQLKILDSAPEPYFDALCRIARDLFDVPITSIAFLDADRQWFKASCGIEFKSTPRVVSFCARTILLDAPLVVVDAAADPRFAGNPFVVGAPGIRFYAGAPIAIEPGLRIGTFCLIDRVPRHFSPLQLQQLQDLVTVLVAQLRLRKAIRRQADIMVERYEMADDDTATAQ